MSKLQLILGVLLCLTTAQVIVADNDDLATACGNGEPAKCPDGTILDVFHAIYERTHIYPDDEETYSRFLVVNYDNDQCLAIEGGEVGNGKRVVTSKCEPLDQKRHWSQLFYLLMGTGGYASLGTFHQTCIGAGNKNGTHFYTNTDHCDLYAYHFKVVVHDHGVEFQSRQSKSCITAAAGIDQPIYVAPCDRTNKNQLWNFCDPLKQNCYPSQAAVKKNVESGSH